VIIGLGTSSRCTAYPLLSRKTVSAMSTDVRCAAKRDVWRVTSRHHAKSASAKNNGSNIVQPIIARCHTPSRSRPRAHLAEWNKANKKRCPHVSHFYNTRGAPAHVESALMHSEAPKHSVSSCCGHYHRVGDSQRRESGRLSSRNESCTGGVRNGPSGVTDSERLFGSIFDLGFASPTTQTIL